MRHGQIHDQPQSIMGTPRWYFNWYFPATPWINRCGQIVNPGWPYVLTESPNDRTNLGEMRMVFVYFSFFILCSSTLLENILHMMWLNMSCTLKFQSTSTLNILGQRFNGWFKVKLEFTGVSILDCDGHFKPFQPAGSTANIIIPGFNLFKFLGYKWVCPNNTCRSIQCFRRPCPQLNQLSWGMPKL